MKKSQLLAATLTIVALGLSACGGSNAGNASSSSATGGNGGDAPSGATLVVATNNSGDGRED